MHFRPYRALTVHHPGHPESAFPISLSPSSIVLSDRRDVATQRELSTGVVQWGGAPKKPLAFVTQWYHPPDALHSWLAHQHPEPRMSLNTSFNIPKHQVECATLTAAFAADDHVTSISINGRSVAVPDRGGYGWLTSFTIPAGADFFVAHSNTLRINVRRCSPCVHVPSEIDPVRPVLHALVTGQQ